MSPVQSSLFHTITSCYTILGEMVVSCCGSLGSDTDDCLGDFSEAKGAEANLKHTHLPSYTFKECEV